MDKIYFKSNGVKLRNPFEAPPTGWIALGPCGVHDDGTHLLSTDCLSVSDIEKSAKYLKHLIDVAVNEAKKRLPA